MLFLMYVDGNTSEYDSDSKSDYDNIELQDEDSPFGNKEDIGDVSLDDIFYDDREHPWFGY